MPSFFEHQRRFFSRADAGRFAWQTGNPYFARAERDLLGGFPLGPGQRVLEVGCGEGGNMANLLRARREPPRLTVGVDLFEPKLRFAARQGLPASFVCADARALPFHDAAFDAVLCRDLLHHLEDGAPALGELRRVASPGGVVWIVEPNGRNPLIRLLAWLRPHERRLRQSSVASVRALAERFFAEVAIEVRQPMPLYRLVLHYQYGLPRLGGWRPFARLMDATERGFRAVWPRSRWAYVVAALRRPAAPTAGAPRAPSRAP
jgi:ubiquinone/menaquinone biosynthesis C-methylase UbiE